MYLGGVPNICDDAQEAAIGTEHTNLLVEDFYIQNSGTGGGQGDAIDLKKGVSQVTIQDGEIVGTTNLAINLPRIYEDVDQGIVVQRLYIHNDRNGDAGIRGEPTQGSNNPVWLTGVTIRNNIIDSHSSPIRLGTSGPNGRLKNVYIYNNLVYGSSDPGIVANNVQGTLDVRNNLLFDNNGNGNQASLSSSGGSITSSNNAYYGSFGYGTCNNCIDMTATQKNNVVADAAGGDFSLVGGSVVIDKGIQINGFSDDFEGNIRSGLWDIGAYEFSSKVEYYVDPDVAGGGDGSPSNPWTSLGGSQWSVINNALISDDVTVYFSAREASSDTDETTSTQITIERSGGSSHRVTMDGMSKYNTDDSNPSWSAYTGASKFKISGCTANAAISTSGTQSRDYVTIRGFKIFDRGSLQSQGLWYRLGSHVIIEYVDLDSHRGFGACLEATECNDFTIRHNTVTNGCGEMIYVDGSHNSIYRHRDVTIEYNTVHDSRDRIYCSRGEPDGIDIKDGIENLVVRGNIVYNVDERSINSHSPGLFEGNLIYGNVKEGIFLTAYNFPQHSDAWYWDDETIIRNNVIRDCTRPGIKVASSYHDIVGAVKIYSNSLRNNGGGGYNDNIQIEGGYTIHSLSLKNNIFSNANGGNEITISANTNSQDNDYNNIHGTTSGYVGGTHDINSDPEFISSTDMSLQGTSPCINSGTTLSGFSKDFAGNIRSGTWDIGAYEYSGSPTQDTCQSLGFDCCASCQPGTERQAYDSNCPGSEVCCGTCQGTSAYPGPGDLVEAEDGQLTSPMTTGSDPGASGGQYVYSGTVDQGQASYTFQVDQPGSFRLEAMINSQGGGNRNSFFVGLDSQSPANNQEFAWDTTEGSTWEWDVVSLRGPGGDHLTADYDPKIWDLSPGQHTFVINGREANSWLDQLRLVSHCHRADTVTPDCCITQAEIIFFIGDWKQGLGAITMTDVMEGIMLYNTGQGCP
jgi:hypothetical protein